MRLVQSNAELFVPDGCEAQTALERTTALCIAAHHDDIEIMAYHAIVECFGRADAWFTGVVVTDGAGSPRSGVYEKYTDEEMKQVRAEEQKLAACLGKYSVQLLLAYPSGEVKRPSGTDLVEELSQVIDRAQAKVVYTHNLADKHDTHVAVALRTIEAIRRLPADRRPEKLIALEVWRGLDWLCDADKSVFNTGEHPNLAAALLGVFDSQIAGGKRYDLATFGRRTANATFLDSHFVDASDSVSYGVDLSRLIQDDELSPEAFIQAHIMRFNDEVSDRIGRFK